MPCWDAAGVCCWLADFTWKLLKVEKGDIYPHGYRHITVVYRHGRLHSHASVVSQVSGWGGRLYQSDTPFVMLNPEWAAPRRVGV